MSIHCLRARHTCASWQGAEGSYTAGAWLVVGTGRKQKLAGGLSARISPLKQMAAEVRATSCCLFSLPAVSPLAPNSRHSRWFTRPLHACTHEDARNHACVPYHATLQGLARGSLGTSGFTIRIVRAASLAPGSWHLAPAVAADSILQAVQIFRLKGLQCSR